jgi:hypothetical protein
MNRPPLEVADIVRCAGQSFVERSRKWISWQRQERLPLCSRLLQQSHSPTARTASPALPIHSLWQCPLCGGTMQVVERLSAAQLLLRSPPHLSRCTA